MLQKHLNVEILEDNRVVAQQNGGTPGIYKLIHLNENQRYYPNFIDFNIGNKRPFFWIATMDNKNIVFHIYYSRLSFTVKKTDKYKVGLLFKSAKIGDFFYIEDIDVETRNAYLNKPIEDSELDAQSHPPITFHKGGGTHQSKEGPKPKGEPEPKGVSIPIPINIRYQTSNTISVVIPCHFRHFKFIPKLLESYEKQSCPPVEVILILCQYQYLEQDYLKKVETRKYCFEFVVIKLNIKSPAGYNRFLGAEKAKGEIIVFQDADDLPHPQRLEAIKMAFNKHPEIAHICHTYGRTTGLLRKTYDLALLKTQIVNHNLFLNHQEMASYPITNGNIAIRKDVIKQVKWDKSNYRGQDVALNKNIFKVFGKFLIIRNPIYIYREELTVKYII